MTLVFFFPFFRWTQSFPQKRKPGMPPRCRPAASFLEMFRCQALLQKKNKMLEEALQLALKAQEKAGELLLRDVL